MSFAKKILVTHCARAVYTARVPVHGTYTAVYTVRYGPYATVYTARIRVHRRYKAAFTPYTRPCPRPVHIRIHGPCTRPVHGSVNVCVHGLLFLSFTVEALQGKMCQKSLPSAVGRSLGAKISGGRGRPWGIFFGFYKTRHILLSNSANCTVTTCRRFDTIPACDGQTDGQTDRQTEFL